MAFSLGSWSRSVSKRPKAVAEPILTLLLAVFAIAPLTYPGFFQAHSGFLPVFNVAHIAEAPHWGMAAESIEGLRGEGRLPYLLVWPIFRLSGSGVVAIKVGYALAFLLGALGVCAWTRRWWGRRGGVLAATVYTYLPWHLSAVYVRGAYAEAWLWALMPLTLWAAEGVAANRRRGRWLPAALSLALLGATFWTQPGLALLFVAILMAGGLLLFAPHRLRLLAGVTLAVLVALWLLLGAATPATRQEMADHLLYPFQLFSAEWGFGASRPGSQDGLSFQLGLAAVGLTIVALAFWASRPAADDGRADEDRLFAPLGWPVGRSLWFWSGVLVSLLLLTLPFMAFAWSRSALAGLVTYPWQVLALTGPPLAFFAGAAVGLEGRTQVHPERSQGVSLGRMAALPVWAGLVSFTILASYPYLDPRFTQVDPGLEPVALFQPGGAEFPQITLLDYETMQAAEEYPAAEEYLATEITRTLTLTLTWQAVASVAHDYTVFVHLLTGDGTKVTQQDVRPCGGLCPTDAWEPGEIVVDAYRLDLLDDALQPPYRLAVGLYLLASGERAVVVGREDGTVFLDVP
jgi:hypothetical protein